jgi:hypothetical protein
MPDVQFKANIRWRNELLWPASLFGARVPQGLPETCVRAPLYVTAAEMQRLSPSRTIRVVAGLTTADFSVRFDDMQRQWPTVSGASPRRQFQGGIVYWDLLMAVYVVEGFRDFEQIQTTIMEHELLHVADEIGIVKDYMAAQARQDDYVRRYLLEGQPVDESMFRTWFLGTGFQDWIKNGIWVPEHNRRAESRDSGPEWQRYRGRIDSLMRSGR